MVYEKVMRLGTSYKQMVATSDIVQLSTEGVEQLEIHYIAFKLHARIRHKVFEVLRKLAPAKLEGSEKGNLISIAMMSSFAPVAALSSLSNNLNQTLASGRRVLNLLEEEPEVFDIRTKCLLAHSRAHAGCVATLNQHF